jgi:hypothetical protein
MRPLHVVSFCLPPVVLLFAVVSGWSATTVSWERRQTWNPPWGSVYPTAADLDGDLDADLILFQPLAALENTGNGTYATWSSRPDWIAGIEPSSRPPILYGELGDWDADGDSDLFVSVPPYFFRNTGSASAPEWTADASYFSPSGLFWGGRPGAADLDGDGDLDIVFGDDRFVCFFNDGTPSEPSWRRYDDALIDVHPSGWGNDPCFADLDTDGDADLVTAPVSDSSRLQAYENTGTAAEPQWELNLGLLQGVPRDLGQFGAAFPDLSGDARPDAIIAFAYSTESYWNAGTDTPVAGGDSWTRIKALYLERGAAGPSN